MTLRLRRQPRENPETEVFPCGTCSSSDAFWWWPPSFPAFNCKRRRDLECRQIRTREHPLHIRYPVHVLTHRAAALHGAEGRLCCSRVPHGEQLLPYSAGCHRPPVDPRRLRRRRMAVQDNRHSDARKSELGRLETRAILETLILEIYTNHFKFVQN